MFFLLYVYILFTSFHFFKDIRCQLYNLLLLQLQTGPDLEVLIGTDIIIKNVGL